MTCQGMDTYTGENKGLGQNGNYNAVGMTPDASNTLIGNNVDSFDLKLKQVSTFDFSIQGSIYNASGGFVANSTNTITNADLNTSTFTQVSFDFASNFTVTQGFKYVITAVSGDFNNNNRVDIQMNGSSADNNLTAILQSSTWITSSAPCAICFGSSTPPPPSGDTLLFPPPVAYI